MAASGDTDSLFLPTIGREGMRFGTVMGQPFCYQNERAYSCQASVQSKDEAKSHKAELKDGGTLGSLVTSPEQLASVSQEICCVLGISSHIG